MKRFVVGVDRSQALRLPERLDDYVHEDNPVRVIDAFVEALDLGALGFSSANRDGGGRPAYHPVALLKIYIYGYFNRIQSSRRLEREAGRNLELMWLTGRLAPDFKTIADFRKSSGDAITKVCSQFIALCRQMNVFSHAVVAIDGSKFKAVNSRDRNFTAGKVKARRQQLEESVARYLGELDRADRDPNLLPEGRVPHLKEKLAKVREQMQRLDVVEEQLAEAPDHQISLTDPDARSMTSSGRGTGTVGYNVQIAVDADHHLIVAHEVTNVGNDRAQLSPMAKKAREALGAEHMSYRSLLKLIEIERTSATAQSKATAFLDWMANEHFFALVPTVLGLIYLAPDRPGGLIKNSASADPSRVSAGLQNASWDCVYIKQWAIRVTASVGGELWFFASMDTLARLLSRFLFPQSGESSDEAILRVLGLYWRQPRAASLLVQHYAQFRGRQPRPDVVAERMANLDAGIRQTEALLGLPPARLEVA